jgi:hypothetical protein
MFECVLRVSFYPRPKEHKLTLVKCERVEYVSPHPGNGQDRFLETCLAVKCCSKSVNEEKQGCSQSSQ